MSTINLETYARVLVHLACRRGTSAEEILAELSVDAGDLRAAERALREELAGAWPNRKGIAAMKFATALGKELDRLGPELALDRRAEAPVAPAQPDVVVPTYLREPPAPSAPSASSAPSAVAPTIGFDLAAAERPVTTAATTDTDLRSIIAAIDRGALPFTPSTGKVDPKPDAAAGRGPESQQGPVSSLGVAHGAGPKQVFAGTVDVDLSAIVASVDRRAALPFPSSTSAASPSAAAPSMDRPTMELPIPRAPDEPDLSAFPLEVYASITGALARGESREEALARHKLGAEAFDKLAKAWAQRFAREPKLLERFKELARTGAGRRGEP